jgi:hypothetical protein
MTGVGEQRQAVRDDASDGFQDEERGVDDERRQEPPSGKRPQIMGMGVPMAVIMIVVVIMIVIVITLRFAVRSRWGMPRHGRPVLLVFHSGIPFRSTSYYNYTSDGGPSANDFRNFRPVRRGLPPGTHLVISQVFG